MSKGIEEKIHQLYKADKVRFFGLGALGFFLGMKLCDYLFYDEKKHIMMREKLEDEFWKKHG